MHIVHHIDWRLICVLFFNWQDERPVGKILTHHMKKTFWHICVSTNYLCPQREGRSRSLKIWSEAEDWTEDLTFAMYPITSHSHCSHIMSVEHQVTMGRCFWGPECRGSPATSFHTPRGPCVGIQGWLWHGTAV